MSNPWAQPYKDLREMDAFAAGGGAAKIAKTGMSRDQVVALGNKNLKAKPAATGNTLSTNCCRCFTPTAFRSYPNTTTKTRKTTSSRYIR
jgi:hypothetical protein